MKVPELKEELRKKGLPVSGNKKELIERLGLNTTSPSQMKVAELKDKLREKGLAVSGKKNELIKRLKDSERDSSPKKSSKKYVVKEIEYDMGGEDITTLVKPKVNMTWVSPKNSEGIYGQDLSFCNLQGADISGSWFIKCDFSNSNLKDVKFRGWFKKAGVYMENFEGSVFTNAHNIDPKLLKVIKATGGILSEEGAVAQKECEKKAKMLMKKMISSEKKAKELKKEILLLLNDDLVLYNEIRRSLS